MFPMCYTCDIPCITHWKFCCYFNTKSVQPDIVYTLAFRWVSVVNEFHICNCSIVSMFYTMVSPVLLHKHSLNLEKRGNKLQGKTEKRMIKYLYAEWGKNQLIYIHSLLWTKVCQPLMRFSTMKQSMLIRLVKLQKLAQNKQANYNNINGW